MRGGAYGMRGGAHDMRGGARDMRGGARDMRAGAHGMRDGWRHHRVTWTQSPVSSQETTALHAPQMLRATQTCTPTNTGEKMQSLTHQHTVATPILLLVQQRNCLRQFLHLSKQHVLTDGNGQHVQ